jgi:hypothetical protein
MTAAATPTLPSHCQTGRLPLAVTVAAGLLRLLRAYSAMRHRDRLTADI